MDRYLDLDIAVLVDRVDDLYAEEGFDGVKDVLRELSHVLEILQEPEAARHALYCAGAYETGSELQNLVQLVVDHYEQLDGVLDIAEVVDNTMWLPDGWSAAQVKELISKSEEAAEVEDE